MRILSLAIWKGTDGSAVGTGAAIQVGKLEEFIPDGGVSGIVYWHNPSGRTLAQRSTQPLTEMSIRNISWDDKGGGFVGLTTLKN